MSCDHIALRCTYNLRATLISQRFDATAATVGVALQNCIYFSAITYLLNVLIFVLLFMLDVFANIHVASVLSCRYELVILWETVLTSVAYGLCNTITIYMYI